MKTHAAKNQNRRGHQDPTRLRRISNNVKREDHFLESMDELDLWALEDFSDLLPSAENFDYRSMLGGEPTL